MTSIAFLVLLAIAGQEPAKTAVPLPEALPTIDYQLGPGDIISIHVSGLRQFDQTTRVSNSGRIHVPYVGIMLVAGQTAVQVEREIARSIKEHELINEPIVQVSVDQHRARPTYVVGEFLTPGQYVISGEMYLLDLIGKAGGLLDTADDIGYLYRRSSLQPVIQAAVITGDERPSDVSPPPSVSAAEPQESSPAEQVIEINLAELREGARPELNMRLQGGDILYVPRRRPETFWVIGDVHVPGGYTLPRHGQVSAAQAVIYAGGPMPTAKMGSGFLMRHDETGARQAMPVDFKAILDGKRPDIPVRAGDIIFVPNSAVKTVGIGLLNMLPRLAQQMIIF